MLDRLIAQMDEAHALDQRLSFFLAPETLAIMREAGIRSHQVFSQAYPLEVERQRAGFASW